MRAPLPRHADAQAKPTLGGSTGPQSGIGASELQAHRSSRRSASPSEAEAPTLLRHLAPACNHPSLHHQDPRTPLASLPCGRKDGLYLRSTVSFALRDRASPSGVGARREIEPARAPPSAALDTGLGVGDVGLVVGQHLQAVVTCEGNLKRDLSATACLSALRCESALWQSAEHHGGCPLPLLILPNPMRSPTFPLTPTCPPSFSQNGRFFPYPSDTAQPSV